MREAEEIARNILRNKGITKGMAESALDIVNPQLVILAEKYIEFLETARRISNGKK